MKTILIHFLQSGFGINLILQKVNAYSVPSGKKFDIKSPIEALGF